MSSKRGNIVLPALSKKSKFTNQASSDKEEIESSQEIVSPVPIAKPQNISGDDLDISFCEAIGYDVDEMGTASIDIKTTVKIILINYDQVRLEIVTSFLSTCLGYQEEWLLTNESTKEIQASFSTKYSLTELSNGWIKSNMEQYGSIEIIQTSKTPHLATNSNQDSEIAGIFKVIKGDIYLTREATKELVTRIITKKLQSVNFASSEYRVVIFEKKPTYGAIYFKDAKDFIHWNNIHFADVDEILGIHAHVRFLNSMTDPLNKEFVARYITLKKDGKPSKIFLEGIKSFLLKAIPNISVVSIGILTNPLTFCTYNKAKIVFNAAAEKEVDNLNGKKGKSFSIAVEKPKARKN